MTFRDDLMRRMPIALLVGLVFGTMNVLRAYPAMETGPWILDAAFSAPLQMAAMACGVTIGARSRLGARHPIAAAGLAVLATALLSSALRTFLTLAVDYEEGGDRDALELFLYLAWTYCALGALASAYLAQRDRAERSARYLRTAEFERQASERRVIESRLAVIKARVEPEFLFSAISRVQALYRSDIDAAEQRLEDLIVYLRAALPRMRESASTLRDELQLALAYVQVSDAAFAGRLRMKCETPPECHALAFPPMVLLPLVEDALARARRMDRPELEISLEARRDDGAWRIAVSDDCPITRQYAPPSSHLASQPGLLRGFFGNDARIGWNASGPGTCVTLEIPDA